MKSERANGRSSMRMRRHGIEMPVALIASVLVRAGSRKSPARFPARAQIASFNFANKLI